LALVQQASLLDILALEAFAFEQDGFSSAELDIGWVRFFRLSWWRWWL
jgi:hypothetical protein